MCLFEYDEKKAMEAEREEGREEGRKEGRENTILEMVRDGFLPIKEAAKRLGITIEEIKEKFKP